MKKQLKVLLAFALVASMLAGCGGGGSSSGSAAAPGGDSGSSVSSGPKKTSLVVGISAEANTLDPQMTTAHQARQVYCNIYDNLVIKDKSGEYIPGLAESWKVSDDGLVYTFLLKKGIKFHNGDELKANDVAFSLTRGKDSSFVSFFYDAFNEIKAIDDYTVEVSLKYPTSVFFEIMSLPQTSIVNQKAVEAAGKDYGRNPVGTGPYKFEKWVSGQAIFLVANEDYYRGAPAIKTVETRIITDKSTGYIALEKGEIDVYYEMSAVDKENALGNQKLSYSEVGSTSYEHIILNTKNEYLKNVKVRQAIAYAIDKESVLIAGNNGVGILADNQIPPVMFGYSDKVKSYEYNAEKGKQLLTEAGYPDGFNLKIKVNSGYREKVAQVIQANLADIGIKLEIEVLEWGTVLADLGEGKFDISLVGKNLHFMDPALATKNSFHTMYSGAGGNFYQYENSDLDKLLDSSLTEIDEVKRKQIFEDILVVLHDDVPNVPLYWNINNVAHDKDLKGLEVLPVSHYKWFDLNW